MATAHINIGSNIGDRLALIRQAVAAIERAFGIAAVCSAPYESAPWGFDSPNRFINIGVNIETGWLTPVKILRRLQQVQAKIDDSSHRTADGAYADRRIDIDLIALDDTILGTPELTLPHPRMHQRDFVLRPMAQILPGWHHPLLHATPAELLGRL